MVALESERTKLASLDKKQRKFDQSLAEEKAISERQVSINQFILSHTNSVSNSNKIANTFSDISQGSVATHVMCGWIFTDGIIANIFLILTVKEFRKSVNSR